MIDRINADDIASRCRSGDLDPRDVVRTALNRIKAAEPEIDAFIHIGEEAALARAELLAREGPPTEGSGLLFGVPIAIKDNICVQDWPLSCGSRILSEYRPIYHATVVERILDEGGVPLGKTNMDEFGMGSSTEHSSFKTTRNPWDRDRIPGGSSGGSAAAVASGALPLALGTDTGGSIRQPASFCGIVGFKPTYGTVSRFGLVAFASSLDQIGPIAANVRDAALLYQVISGHDSRDSTSILEGMPSVLDGLEDGIDGLKIGVPEEYFKEGLDPELQSPLQKGLDLLAKLGAECMEISLPHTRYAIPTYYLVADSECSSNLARYDGMRYGPREEGDLKAAYGLTRSAGFGPEVKRRIILGTFALSSGYYDEYYGKALKVRRLIQEDFIGAFERVDLIVGPTSPIAAFRKGEKIDDPLTMYLCDVFTTPPSLAGIPAVSVPCGLNGDGLPVGLQIMGPALSDPTVLRAARAMETASEEALISSLAKRIGRVT